MRVTERMQRKFGIACLTQQQLRPRAHVIRRVEVAVGLAEDKVVVSICRSELNLCGQYTSLQHRVKV